MSRHYVFGWEARLPGYDPLTDHEQVCGVLYPQAVCGGGCSAGQRGETKADTVRAMLAYAQQHMPKRWSPTEPRRPRKEQP